MIARVYFSYFFFIFFCFSLVLVLCFLFFFFFSWIRKVRELELKEHGTGRLNRKRKRKDKKEKRPSTDWKAWTDSVFYIIAHSAVRVLRHCPGVLAAGRWQGRNKAKCWNYVLDISLGNTRTKKLCVYTLHIGPGVQCVPRCMCRCILHLMHTNAVRYYSIVGR